MPSSKERRALARTIIDTTVSPAIRKPSDDIKQPSSASTTVSNGSVRSYISTLYRQVLGRTDTNGVGRSDPSERLLRPASCWAAFEFWVGCNMTPLNIILGIMGVFEYRLGMCEAIVIAVTASLLASIVTGVIAIYGPRSGLRTMVITRFTHGWYVGGLVGIANVLALITFLVIDVIACREIVHSLVPEWSYAPTIITLVFGTVATIVACTGGSVLDAVGRWSWKPQIITLSLLTGSCLIMINTAEPASFAERPDTAQSKVHSRLGYGTLICNAMFAFCMSGTDFSHGFAPTSQKWRVMMGPVLGLSCSSAALVTTGVVVDQAARRSEPLTEAYTKSSASLIGLSFFQVEPVGALCAVCFIVATFGGIAAGLYVAAIPCGLVCGRYDQRTRSAFSVAIGIITMVSANAGRDRLGVIAASVVSIVGPLASVWWVSTIVDLAITRRSEPHWEDWDMRSRLSFRTASVAALVVGLVGSILFVDQTWYRGKLAELAGPAGDYVGKPYLSSKHIC